MEWWNDGDGDWKAKFAKSYADISEKTITAINSYCKEVTDRKYPDDSHSYHMKKGELQRLEQMLKVS